MEHSYDYLVLMPEHRRAQAFAEIDQPWQAEREEAAAQLKQQNREAYEQARARLLKACAQITNENAMWFREHSDYQHKARYGYGRYGR